LRSINIMVADQEEISTANADQQYFIDVNLPGQFEFGGSEPIIQAGHQYVKDNPVDTTAFFEKIDSESEEQEKDINIIIEEPETTRDKLGKVWQQVKDFVR